MVAASSRRLYSGRRAGAHRRDEQRPPPRRATRHAALRKPRHDRIQRVADEHADDERNEELLGPVQREDRRHDGQHGEAAAPDADRRRNRRGRLLVVGLLRIEERRLGTHHGSVARHASACPASAWNCRLISDGGLRAFCSGHDDELYVERGVAHDEEAGHAGLAVAIGLDGALPRELATELRRERILLVLPGREEQRARAGRRRQSASAPRVSRPSTCWRPATRPSCTATPWVSSCCRTGRRKPRGPVGEQPDVGAPREQREGQRRATLARCRERRVARRATPSRRSTDNGACCGRSRPRSRRSRAAVAHARWRSAACARAGARPRSSCHLEAVAARDTTDVTRSDRHSMP